MDATGAFCASNLPRNNPPCCSDCSWKWWYRGKNKCCRNFSCSEIGPDFACPSTTSGPMDKWMLQAHSAHQTGLKPTLHTLLIVIESGDRGWWKTLAEFFTLRNWRCFCLYLDNQQSYDKLEGTARFSASNWSKANSPRLSDCRLLVLHKGMKMCGRNFLLSDSDRAWEFLCNLLTRDFAYLSILYGSKRECQPAWLIALFTGCLVTFWCCSISGCCTVSHWCTSTVSPYYTVLLRYTVLQCITHSRSI